MQLAVCAVRDSKTGLFDNPFAIRHVGDAIRQFEQVSKDPQTKFGMNPEDFQMFQLATFDDETGTFSTISPAVHLSNAIDNSLKAVKNEK